MAALPQTMQPTRARIALHRQPCSVQSLQSRYASSSSSPARSSPFAAYKPFVRPFAKVFLGSMLTFQIVYWAYEKLRLDELREDKIAELRDLQARVDQYSTGTGIDTGIDTGRANNKITQDLARQDRAIGRPFP